MIGSMDSSQTCFGTCIRQEVEITSGNWYSALLKLSRCGHFPKIYLPHAYCLANTYFSSYVHCRRNICHQCGNIFGKSCDFNCHFFSLSNMWSLLYHLHKSWLCNIVNIVAPQPYCHIKNYWFIGNNVVTFWFIGNNSGTFWFIGIIYGASLSKGNNSWQLHLPYHHIIVGVVAQALEVVGEILPGKNHRGNSLGLSAPWWLPWSNH